MIATRMGRPSRGQNPAYRPTQAHAVPLPTLATKRCQTDELWYDTRSTDFLPLTEIKGNPMGRRLDRLGYT